MDEEKNLDETTPENTEENSDDNPVDIQSEKVEEPARKPLSTRQVINRVKTPVKAPVSERDATNKKKNYLIFSETILIFLLIGAVAYLVYGIYTGNLSKHKNAVIENQKLAQQIEEQEKKYEEIKKLKTAAEKNLASNLEELETSRGFVEKAKAEIKKLTDAGSPEKFKAEVAQKQEEINGLNERVEKLTRESEKASRKLAELEDEYNKLKTQLSTAEATRQTKQEEIKKIYGEYETKALKSLEELQSINSALEKGITVIEFAKELERITPVIDELKNNSESYSKLASYHLITAAFNSYKTSEEVWKRLSITYLPEKFFDLPKAELKLEMPIKEYRPWVDGMQVNWIYAQYYSKAAEALIKNKEDLQNTQCPACMDKLTVVCPKCSASGQCFVCNGHGIDENKGDTACTVCEGSGYCGLCRGKKEITCPVWMTTVRNQ